MEYNAKQTPPPTDREILVQIINSYGHCDLEWHPCRFDPSIDGSDLAIYDADDNIVGEVWFWKDKPE